MNKYYLRLFISIFLITILSTALFSKTKRVQEIKEKVLMLYSTDNNKMIYLLLNIENQGLTKKEMISLFIELQNYYIGEAPGEILSEKITGLGDEIVPYLIEKKNSPLKSDKKNKRLYYNTSEEINYSISRNISYIKKGIISYSEYPDSSLLNKIVKEDERLINIFIKDYKIKYNKSPENLLILRDYAYKAYGYKLRIYNPWGDLYEYKRK